jgi:predicted phosphodiesterase
MVMDSQFYDEQETVIRVKGLKESLAIMHITDAHISCDDASDEPYIQYSARMKGCFAPGVHRHFKTQAPCFSLDCFSEILSTAREKKPDLLVLTGDMINYPSATAVTAITKLLQATQIPWIYTAGNHDWHYEGMEGSEESLRETWTEKRLKPLYGGSDPLCSSLMIKGLNIEVIDSSTYQINEKQLEFFKQQAALPGPLVIFTHIPLYMPTMHICCGHPDWGATTDKDWEIERRERWPETGNRPATMEFIKQVMAAENMAGIFSGHWHSNQVITCEGKTQYITGMAATGQYRLIHFRPASVIAN